MGLPALTILAVEEPENSLSPFFLSRIVGQMLDLAGGRRAQTLVSSHSPSVLAHVQPECVRHFRIDRRPGLQRSTGSSFRPTPKTQRICPRGGA